MLGVGDFYYELGIQVVESCLVWQETTGGLTDICVIKRRLSKLRGAASAPVTEYFPQLDVFDSKLALVMIFVGPLQP